MRHGTAGLLILLAAGAAFAEHRAVVQVAPPSGFRTFGSRHGFGNIVMPGTGTLPNIGVSPFSITDSTFAQRLGATVSGFPPYTGAPSGGRGRGFGGTLVVPYAYPVMVGGYSYPYQQQPANVTIIYTQPPAPQVIQQVEPEPPRPVIREYREEQTESGIRFYEVPPRAPAEPAEEQVLFLIALTDSSIYSAVAYWVEGDTLHYITPQGKHNQVSIDLVDRTLSEKLNRGRKIEFRLPPGRK